MSYIISSTITAPATIILSDLGWKRTTPFSNIDLELTYTIDELYNSKSLKDALNAGFITAVNENGYTINPTDKLVSSTNSNAQYQPLNSKLTGLANLDTTNGIITQIGTNTFTKRQINGTDNRIIITNNDGSAGNPIIDIGSQVVNFTNLHASSTTTTSQNTTATFQSISDLNINSVPIGNYLLYFSASIRNSNNSGLTIIAPFIGSTQVTNVQIRQSNGGNQFSDNATRIPISLNAIPITVSSVSTVDMRWTVSAGTTTMYERYLTLIRVG
jgi:hypothetical protein